MTFFETPSRRPRQPIFNLPAGVQGVALFLIVVHIARQFLPSYQDNVLVLRLAFIPQLYALGTQPPTLGSWHLLTSPVTYMVLHASWLHLGLNLLSLIAFGSAVERLAGTRRMLAVLILSGLGAAALQACFAGPELMVLIGASGGISGLFAVAFLAYAPPQKLWQRTLAILILSVVMVITGMAGIPGSNLPIAWPAHLGGFYTGLVLARFLKPRRRLPPPPAS